MALQESAVDLNLTSLSVYWLPWKNGVLPANFFLPANFETAITNNSQLAVEQSWEQLKCQEFPGKSRKKNVYTACVLSCFCCVWLFVTPWTEACQVPLSMEFSRQEYCSGLPFPSPEEHPNPGIESWSPASQADSLPFELQVSPSTINDLLGAKRR